MKFKEGDIVLFNYNDNVYHKCIQWFNKRKYGEAGPTHVGIIGQVGTDKVVIYEALSDGFVKRDYEKWWLEARYNDLTIDIRRSKIKLNEVQKSCEKYLGRGYAWLDIISIGLSFLTGFRLLGLTGARKLICSEGVARVLYDASNKEINIAEEFDKSYNLVTPMDIALSDQLKDV